MALLEKHSSEPVLTWLDELVNSGKHGFNQYEIDAFLQAIEGRYVPIAKTAFIVLKCRIGPPGS